MNICLTKTHFGLSPGEVIIGIHFVRLSVCNIVCMTWCAELFLTGVRSILCIHKYNKHINIFLFYNDNEPDGTI